MSIDWKHAELIRIETASQQTWRFYFKVQECDVFNFKAGQFITFELPIHEVKSRRLRSYSIASYPDGSNIVELIIVLNPEGLGTPYLFNEIKIGDVLPFRGPLGKFVLPDKLEHELCFICTGTGIAPFRSQLLDIHHNHKSHKGINLIFGSRYLPDLLYHDEMVFLQNEISSFSYYPTLSREKEENWAGTKGYVHPIYEQLFSGRDDVDFYICGWKNMITEARERLTAMGLTRSRIHFESYG